MTEISAVPAYNPKVLDDDDGHTYHGPLELVERIELDDSPAWSLF